MIVLRAGKQARRPRLEDVAAEAGVSSATVSLVLRGSSGPSATTRERVQEAATRLGYRPDRAASALASRRSRLIGVVMDVRNDFHAQLVEDIHEAAERYEYNLLLSTVTRTRDEKRAVETLVDSRCEALVLLGPEAPAARLATLGRQLPVVVIGRPVPSGDVYVIRAADDEGVAQAVDYLAGLGHSRIAHIDGGSGTIATLRRRGYRRAMRRQHLGDRLHVVKGGHTEESGAKGAHALLRCNPRPTAVLTFNDRCAMGLLDTLIRAGVDIPGEMSVVGYDDSPTAGLAHINLSSVNQNTRELTERAVTTVVERLDENHREHREIVVPPRLVIRGTTGPPPH